MIIKRAQPVPRFPDTVWLSAQLFIALERASEQLDIHFKPITLTQPAIVHLLRPFSLPDVHPNKAKQINK